MAAPTFNIVAAIVFLGILIFVHELGHFWLAKWKGVLVKKFSLGFGPKVLGRKLGETEYVISAVPLGGYVKMLGEAPGEEVAPEDVPRSFTHQSVGRRALIVVAGPIFNLFFAVFVFFLIFLIGLPVLTATIGEVKEGSPAEEAGIRVGDTVVSVDGREIKNWEEMALVIRRSTEESLSVTVQRGGKLIVLKVWPKLDEVATPFGEKQTVRVIGITPAGTVRQEKSLNPVMALYYGLDRTAKMTALIIVGVVKLIQGVVPAKELGGPLLIVKLAGESARAGLVPYLGLMAFISINLAILNLLPIPILDGGHLAFFAFEAVAGRPLSLKKREIAQQVGLFILFIIMALAFRNDIMRFFF